MTIEPFKMTFSPASEAVRLLAEIANDPASPFASRAGEVLENWRSTLATPAQMAMVETSDELEVDDAGACISEGDDGFFIQTWSWVPVEASNEDEDEE